jgi:uncharacterized membrane protein YphA (DoxX/SURF4 family)
LLENETGKYCLFFDKGQKIIPCCSLHLQYQKEEIMNTILWVLQALMAAVFLYSGINKSLFSIPVLVHDRGQTGIENLSLSLVRFIGISEILGAVGLIAPWYFNILPVLTPIAAMLFAIIMIPAAVIHYTRKEPKNVLTNVIVFLICIAIAYGRAFPPSNG